MRWLGWILIQYDWCPYTKGKFGHRDRHAQMKDDAKTQRRWPWDASTSQGMPKIVDKHPKLQEASSDFLLNC